MHDMVQGLQELVPEAPVAHLGAVKQATHEEVFGRSEHLVQHGVASPCSCPGQHVWWSPSTGLHVEMRHLAWPARNSESLRRAGTQVPEQLHVVLVQAVQGERILCQVVNAAVLRHPRGQ